MARLKLSTLFSDPILFGSYTVFIIVLVTFPFSLTNELNNNTILRFRADYFLHSLLFLPWAFFLPAFRIQPPWWLMMGLLFASGSEGIQYFLPYRAWNVNDLVANGIGIVVGTLIVYGITKLKKYF